MSFRCRCPRPGQAAHEEIEEGPTRPWSPASDDASGGFLGVCFEQTEGRGPAASRTFPKLDNFGGSRCAAVTDNALSRRTPTADNQRPVDRRPTKEVGSCADLRLQVPNVIPTAGDLTGWAQANAISGCSQTSEHRASVTTLRNLRRRGDSGSWTACDRRTPVSDSAEMSSAVAAALRLRRPPTEAV
jgi:hypothetical protein